MRKLTPNHLHSKSPNIWVSRLDLEGSPHFHPIYFSYNNTLVVILQSHDVICHRKKLKIELPLPPPYDMYDNLLFFGREIT